MFCGPKFGMLRSVLAVTLLADFDYSEPVAVGIGGTGSFSSAYATDEWEDFSTGTVPNISGTETLANTGGLTDRDTQLWNGTDFTTRRGWESISATDSLDSSGTSALDSNSADIAGRMLMRSHEAGSASYLASKRTGATNGWSIQVLAAGTVRIELNDGTTTIQKDLVADHTDGAWHEIAFWYDFSANLLYAKSSKVADASVSTAAMTGSLTNAAATSVGDGTSGAGFSGWQCGYFGGCVGATNAQNFYDEEIVLPGADPGAYDTDKTALATKTRGSLVSVPISATGVCHFADDTLPVGYKSAFTNAEKLGLFTNSARVNLCGYSEAMGSWSATSATVTDNDADAPDGFRSATKIAATGSVGHVYINATTVASTEYTFSVWIKRSGGSDVAGDIRLYDQTGYSYYGNVAYTATGTWQLVTLTATSPAGSIVGQLYITVDTSGEAVHAWGAQFNLGDSRGDTYVRTNGGSASLVVSTYNTTAAADTLIKAASGEIEAVWIQSFPNNPSFAAPYIFDAWGTGNANRIFCWVSSDGRDPTFRTHDSSSVLSASIGKAIASDMSTQENTVVVQWDDSGGLSSAPGADASFQYIAEAVVNDIGSYTTTPTLANFAIGTDRALGSNNDACFQRIRIWDGERA